MKSFFVEVSRGHASDYISLYINCFNRGLVWVWMGLNSIDLKASSSPAVSERCTTLINSSRADCGLCVV